MLTTNLNNQVYGNQIHICVVNSYTLLKLKIMQKVYFNVFVFYVKCYELLEVKLNLNIQRRLKTMFCYTVAVYYLHLRWIVNLCIFLRSEITKLALIILLYNTVQTFNMFDNKPFIIALIFNEMKFFNNVRHSRGTELFYPDLYFSLFFLQYLLFLPKAI